MDSLVLATSAAAVAQAARAARDASGVLDELLVGAKFRDDSLRLEVKRFLEDTDVLQSHLVVAEGSQNGGSEEQQALHSKLQDAMALSADTFDQFTIHARDAGKAKSSIFRQSRKLSGRDEMVIRVKQRIPVHTMMVQLLSANFHV